MASTVYDAILGSTTVRQVSNVSLNPNLSVMKERYSGGTHIAAQFIDSGEPVLDLTTADIEGFLAAFRDDTHESLRVANGNTVIVPWNGRADGGTFQSGSNHVRVRGYSTTSPVQLVPMSISAPTKGPATAQGQVHFLSRNGAEVPHQIQTSQALASQAFNACFRQGPLSVNGSLIDEQIEFTLNFGVTLSEKKHYAGGNYPTSVFIQTVEPSIQFTQEAFAYLSSIINGVDISSVSAFLRKCVEGSTVEADAATEHIEFSFAGGLMTPQSVSASGTSEGRNSIMIQGEVLTVATGVAIA